MGGILGYVTKNILKTGEQHMNHKKNLGNIFLALPFGIAIITCLIVNYALNRQLTWAVIAAGGCIFAYLALFTLIFGGKHRILLTYGVLCILLIPYLYVIERISNLYLTEPIYWAKSFGAPVSICWLAACGALGLFRKLTHANGWITAGVGILLFFMAERFTNYKVDELTGTSDSIRLSEHYPFIYLGAAAVLIVIGLMLTGMRRIRKRV